MMGLVYMLKYQLSIFIFLYKIHFFTTQTMDPQPRFPFPLMQRNHEIAKTISWFLHHIIDYKALHGSHSENTWLYERLLLNPYIIKGGADQNSSICSLYRIMNFG